MSFAIVKLKQGTSLSIDFHGEIIEENDTSLKWLAEKNHNDWIALIRPGYGVHIANQYGNGSAFLLDKDKMELLTPWCLLDSPLLSDVRSWKR